MGAGFGDAGQEVVADVDEALVLGGVGTQEGAADACLTCPVFITGPEFLPELREHRGRTLTLIDKAEAHGQMRVVQMNTEVLANLDKMIGEIDQEPAGTADAS